MQFGIFTKSMSWRLLAFDIFWWIFGVFNFRLLLGFLLWAPTCPGTCPLLTSCPLARDTPPRPIIPTLTIKIIFDSLLWYVRPSIIDVSLSSPSHVHPLSQHDPFPGCIFIWMYKSHRPDLWLVVWAEYPSLLILFPQTHYFLILITLCFSFKRVFGTPVTYSDNTDTHVAEAENSSGMDEEIIWNYMIHNEIN